MYTCVMHLSFVFTNFFRSQHNHNLRTHSARAELCWDICRIVAKQQTSWTTAKSIKMEMAHSCRTMVNRHQKSNTQIFAFFVKNLPLWQGKRTHTHNRNGRKNLHNKCNLSNRAVSRRRPQVVPFAQCR